MIDPPEIVQTEARRAAVIPLTIPREEIRSVMGPGLEELYGALAAQGLTPAGPWYSYHRRLDPAVFDFEIGVPVDADVAPTGRVRPGERPAATVARTVYHGPYEGLGAAWGELGEWIGERGHGPAPDLWERYLSGPEADPDPETWRTELNRPLLDDAAGG